MQSTTNTHTPMTPAVPVQFRSLNVSNTKNKHCHHCSLSPLAHNTNCHWRTSKETADAPTMWLITSLTPWALISSYISFLCYILWTVYDGLCGQYMRASLASAQSTQGTLGEKLTAEFSEAAEKQDALFIFAPTVVVSVITAAPRGGGEETSSDKAGKLPLPPLTTRTPWCESRSCGGWDQANSRNPAQETLCSVKSPWRGSRAVISLLH